MAGFTLTDWKLSNVYQKTPKIRLLQVIVLPPLFNIFYIGINAPYQHLLHLYILWVRIGFTCSSIFKCVHGLVHTLPPNFSLLVMHAHCTQGCPSYLYAVSPLSPLVMQVVLMPLDLVQTQAPLISNTVCSAKLLLVMMYKTAEVVMIVNLTCKHHEELGHMHKTN